jgi:5-methylcytosine-specific restriction endonuclease McrA
MAIKTENHKKIRRHFIKLLGFKCRYCGSKENIEFDHIVPKSRKIT